MRSAGAALPVASAGPTHELLPRHIAALDGLRALAVLMVVLTHAAFLTGSVAAGGVLGRIWGRGDFGVALFFGLSGYLLHRGFLRREARAAPGLDLRGYAWRRAARVLPAYWLTLAVVVLIARPPARDVVSHALVAQIYLPGSHIDSFSQSWSLATEVSFYACLPLLVLLLRRIRRRDPALPLLWLSALAVAGVGLAAVAGSADVTADLPLERWLPARAGNFLVGMVLAEAQALPAHPITRRLRELAGQPLPVLALGAAGYLLSTTALTGQLTLGPSQGWQLAAKMALSSLVTLALMLPVVLGTRSRYTTILAAALPAWLGRISYGIFLWHLPVFMAAFAVTGLRPFAGGMVPLLIGGGLVTLALAAASYTLIELPAMRLAARHGSPPPPEASTPQQG